MRLADYITDYLVENGYIPPEEHSIYSYGFDVIVYTIWSTALLILMGLLMKQFLASLIIIFGFYSLQSVGGGYHAKTHFRCMLTMIIGLYLGLHFVNLRNFPIILWTLFFINSIILLVVPLVLHPNKAYLKRINNHLVVKSFLLTSSLIIITVCVNTYTSTFLYAFAATFTLAGISRVSGKILYQRIQIQSSNQDFD